LTRAISSADSWLAQAHQAQRAFLQTAPPRKRSSLPRQAESPQPCRARPWPPLLGQSCRAQPCRMKCWSWNKTPLREATDYSVREMVARGSGEAKRAFAVHCVNEIECDLKL